MDVFVFGSNLQGRHGKGAAKHARLYYGAIYGVAEGRQGSSYGIPTKSSPWRTLPLHKIKDSVERFKQYAREHWEESFNVTEIGCGLAGYTPKEIAPMFKDSPENVNLPQSFIKEINANSDSRS